MSRNYGSELQSNTEIAEWLMKQVNIDRLDEGDIKSLLALAFQRIADLESTIDQLGRR